MFPGFPDAAAAQPEPQPASPSDDLIAWLEGLKTIFEESGGRLDEIELVAYEKIRTEVMKILGDRSKQDDALMQGKLDPRAVRRMA